MTGHFYNNIEFRTEKDKVWPVLPVDRPLFQHLHFLDMRARVLLKVATKVLLELKKS